MSVYYPSTVLLSSNFLAEKHLLALRCLLSASAIDAEHPKVHEHIVRFKQAMDADAESINPTSAEIIKSEFTLFPASKSLAEYNDEYLSKHKSSASSTLSALRVRKILNPASNPDKDIVGVLNLQDITLETAVSALELLKSWKSSEVESFQSTAAAKWPKATLFQDSA